VKLTISFAGVGRFKASESPSFFISDSLCSVHENHLLFRTGWLLPTDPDYRVVTLVGIPRGILRHMRIKRALRINLAVAREGNVPFWLVRKIPDGVFK